MEQRPFRHRFIDDPDLYAKKCKEVTDTIHKFFIGDYHVAYEALYRTVYDIVLNKFGEELYSAVEAALASGVQDLNKALNAGEEDDDGQFLRELLDKWNKYTRSLTSTRDIVMYMDRTYVATNKKTPIHEVGVCLWRDTMIRSEKVWPRLMEAMRMSDEDEAMRSDEDEAAASVLEGLKSMLKELGDDNMLKELSGEVYIPRT